ncbi:MAG: glycosyltransferase [Clostridiales bacterium]|nr:glycosyltransferase [Clostridiales bacterium]MCC8107016.1 glycosyltransferase [Clostridiales bacterium]
MRVIQLLTSILYGDAVSNDTLTLADTLQRAGYETGIYAEYVDLRLPDGKVYKIEQLPQISGEDVIIYHLSTGSRLNYKVAEYPCRKIVIYHNITPYSYFEKYSFDLWKLCKFGLEGMRFLSDKVDYCLAVSEYNKADLIKAGYSCPIDVLPILIPFSDYEKDANEEVIKKYSDEHYVNLLFTGRIAPNKKQEDVIRAFAMYQKYYNPRSRLFIVGSYNGTERYYNRLIKYVRELQLENSVYFTGHVSFGEILAYYKIANVFLCMSAHEGFCVPLVEAMYFGVPVIAHDSSAIGDTLNGSGVLLKEKKPLETAGMIHYLMTHSEERESIVMGQYERLRDFEHAKIEKQFLGYLEKFIHNQR